jgi:ABC-2 type transport system ATP-binding protein
LPEVAGRVGAIVESPQFFGNFTAQDTLTLLADAGGVDHNRVFQVLELVGLRERAKDRVKTYSLGMKQRLAVASALLKEPALLILDEPANGLDPGGIREMRTLMRTLSESGMTVLLSSHILGEIQLICDSVTIISAGKRVAHGSVAEVLARHESSSVKVRLEPGVDLRPAVGLLRANGAEITVETDHFVVANAGNPAQITRLLSEEQIYVYELTPLAADLESVFLELTGTAPVEGRNRQVDQTVMAPAAGGWGE